MDDVLRSKFEVQIRYISRTSIILIKFLLFTSNSFFYLRPSLDDDAFLFQLLRVYVLLVQPTLQP